MRSALLVAISGTALVAGAIGAIAGLSVSATPEPPAVETVRNRPAYCADIDTMDRYACLIEAAARGADGRRDTDLLPAYKAMAAMQTVQTIASSSRYDFWNSEGKMTIPGSSSQHVCLDEGFGICGNHMLLFVDLMRRMGVPAHRVEFYYADPENGQRLSHAAAEFEFNGKWRFVDITWGSIWFADRRDISTWLSLDEVRNGNGERVTDRLNPWYFSRRQAGYDPFTYLANGADIIIEGDGTVNLPFAEVDGHYAANFASIPTYVGDNKDDGEDRRVRIRIPEIDSATMTVDIAGHGACNDSRIAFGPDTMPIDNGEIVFRDVNGGILEIRGGDPACYVVFKGITLDATAHS